MGDEKLPSHRTHWASPQANQRDISICPQIVDHGPQIILLKTQVLHNIHNVKGNKANGNSAYATRNISFTLWCDVSILLKKMRIISTLPLAHGKFHIFWQWCSNINVTKNNLDWLIILLDWTWEYAGLFGFSRSPLIGLCSILSTFIQLEPLTVLSSHDQALGKFCQLLHSRCYSSFQKPFIPDITFLVRRLHSSTSAFLLYFFLWALGLLTPHRKHSPSYSTEDIISTSHELQTPSICLLLWKMESRYLNHANYVICYP